VQDTGKGQIILVDGHLGAGKTALLQHMAAKRGDLHSGKATHTSVSCFFFHLGNVDTVGSVNQYSFICPAFAAKTQSQLTLDSFPFFFSCPFFFPFLSLFLSFPHLSVGCRR
jgi:hypothetical protein